MTDSTAEKDFVSEGGQLVEVESGGYKLKGNLVLVSNSVKPAVLIGHGAANNQNPIEYLGRLQEFLAQHGYSSLVIHNRGVGKGKHLSEGPYESTIMERVADFESAAAFLLSKRVSPDLFLVACSLNGETAALTSTRLKDKLKAIALLEPAAYTPGTENIRLGTSEFTHALRRPDLLPKEKTELQMQSPTFNALQQFSGSLFVAYGEMDEKIDKPIQDKYEQIVKQKGIAGEFLKVTGATHSLTAHASDMFYEKLVTFLDNQKTTSSPATS